MQRLIATRCQDMGNDEMANEVIHNPYKSKRQMRRFFAMEKRGELEKGTARRWARETKNIKGLPERVKRTKRG